MKKEERIEKYGPAAFEKQVQQCNVRKRKWRETNPEEVKKESQESSCKAGKYYDVTQERRRHGIPHEKFLIRTNHAKQYRSYKQIIAPDSQLHHEWIPGTADYMGVALVEANQHQHGFIDVIQILEGEITLLTEAEIRGGF